MKREPQDIMIPFELCNKAVYRSSSWTTTTNLEETKNLLNY